MNNLNRIRNQILAISGEAWGTVSTTLAALSAKFHATTGHGHTGAAGDAPILDHGGLAGLSDDDHTRYFDKDGSKAMTGGSIFRNVKDSFIFFNSGTEEAGSGAAFLFYGADYATVGGYANIVVPNAAKSAYLAAITISGCTDTPAINFNARRCYNVPDPSAAQDAATRNYVDTIGKAWAAWTITAVWGTATPASVTSVSRWTQAGRVVYFALYINSTDSNGATSLTISLPVTPSHPGINTAFTAFQIYGASGTSYIDPLAYLNEATDKIQFLNFQAGTDGQRIAVRVQGFYEVA